MCEEEENEKERTKMPSNEGERVAIVLSSRLE